MIAGTNKTNNEKFCGFFHLLWLLFFWLDVVLEWLCFGFFACFVFSL